MQQVGGMVHGLLAVPTEAVKPPLATCLPAPFMLVGKRLCVVAKYG